MHLKRFSIRNFRGIAELDLELDDITVLIGENNSGKTSVLEALQLCMNRSIARRQCPFGEYDYHLAAATSEPQSAPEMSLTLVFEEKKEDEWPKEVVQAFPDVLQVLDDGRQQLILRVTSSFNKAVKEFAVDWVFLDRRGTPIAAARSPMLLPALYQLAPLFYLAAVRDAAHHFGSKGSFWNPFTKNADIAPDKQAELEKQIGDINRTVLDGHKPFKVVKEKLAQIGSLLPLAPTDIVTVEAVPARLFDMLAKTQVRLACRTGARLPLANHGAGAQSLSVVFLFQAYLESRLQAAFEKASVPLIALEEPESHLHPSAVRAHWPTLASLHGQKLVATHSGDLMAAAPLTSLRRLVRRNGKVCVYSVKPATLSARDLQKVAFHVREKRGSLLFSRVWLLVEGWSEFALLPELSRVLGHDLDRCGVSVVDFQQCGLETLIKLAVDLGIEWHVLADGDPAGNAYVKTGRKYLSGEAEQNRISQIAEKDIEHCFWGSGFASVYESLVDANRRKNIKVGKTDPTYPTAVIEAAEASGSKPQSAYAVAEEVAKRGAKSIPIQVKAALTASVALAGRCD